MVSGMLAIGPDSKRLQSKCWMLIQDYCLRIRMNKRFKLIQILLPLQPPVLPLCPRGDGPTFAQLKIRSNGTKS